MTTPHPQSDPSGRGRRGWDGSRMEEGSSDEEDRKQGEQIGRGEQVGGEGETVTLPGNGRGLLLMVRRIE